MDVYTLGTMLDDRYEVVRVLRGGMGVVYVAFDIALEQPVAIKTLRPEYLPNNEAVNLFLTESQAWIQLERHTHLVQAKSTFLIDKQPFIVTEYVDGGSLRELLIPDRGLGLEKSLLFALQFCEGASYAYRKLRLIHRDIKPENILITKEGILKISDFGLSKIADEPGVRSRGIGTPLYMSPEQWVDSSVVAIQSDIYSFGIVIYEMLTGQRPFNGKTISELQKKHLDDLAPSIRMIDPDIPEQVDSIVIKCLDKNPLKRFLYYEDLAEQLKQVYENCTGTKYQPHSDEKDTDTEYSQAELLNNGDSLLVIGKFQEALRYYDRLLELNPKLGIFWQRKGSALSKQGKDYEAVLYLSKAVELEPSNLGAAKDYIRCLIRLDRQDVALAYCRQVLSVNTSDRDLLKLKQELLHRGNISKDSEGLIGKQGRDGRIPNIVTEPNFWGKSDETSASIYPSDED